MTYKKIIACINAENEMDTMVLRIAEKYSHEGADELFLYNYAKDEASREEFLKLLKKIGSVVDIPFFAGYYAEGFEDVKKLLYTGASQIVIREDLLTNEEGLEEAIERFGTDKFMIELQSQGDFSNYESSIHWERMGFGTILLKHVEASVRLAENIAKSNLPVIIRDSLTRHMIGDIININNVIGVATNYYKNKNLMKAKQGLRENGVLINLFESTMAFSQFKKNSDGLVPVVTQDYKTGEVLMVAYMNEEAYRQTIETGKMVYYSRSRQELWCKGETSGHYQYIKHLMIDCDSDTILAKVRQIGAACHTGHATCFFTDLVKKDYDDTNPLTVFQDVYDIIKDRKKNPKEGSYTNYLFDKGIDKILKKCGEEATEIVIAAKNPEKEELKYEISDFLYHLMVLMAECGLDWSDVTKELAHRR